MTQPLASESQKDERRRRMKLLLPLKARNWEEFGLLPTNAFKE